MPIDDLLRMAVSQGASDLHIKAGSQPYVRIHGELRPLGQFQPLSDKNTMALALSIMNAPQQQRFQEQLEIDLAYGISDSGRFRVNIFQQRGSVSLVFRVIPSRIPSFEELLLPPVLGEIAMETRGLVLVTGTSGSGKSTTLASMIDFINQRRTCHIITIEDPLEFLHADNKSIISQREVFIDALTFASSLKNALRQDPDIILVGEMRDQETIETALLAAETGHLVFSTLHTLDAPETINRIVAAFPPHQQKQIRLQLASVLRSVISMRLIRRSNREGRIPAVEILRSTEFIRSCILEPEKTSLIRAATAAGTSQYRMQTFDQSIYQHYRSGLINLEDALRFASNPDEFKLRVQGIYSTSATAIEEMEKEMSESKRIKLKS